jgi:hypothetical protein
MWERISDHLWNIVTYGVLIGMLFAIGFSLSAQVAQFFGWR